MNITHFENGPAADGQPLEDQLARCTPAGAPTELRGVVRTQVQRELRAARWDRRLSRAASVLLVLGVGMSGLVHRLYPLTPAGPSTRPTPQAIGRLAATVAAATDIDTARQFARQMAALQGWSSQGEEMKTIQRIFQRSQTQMTPNGKDG
jgi:hypothetical protein